MIEGVEVMEVMQGVEVELNDELEVEEADESVWSETHPHTQYCLQNLEPHAHATVSVQSTWGQSFQSQLHPP